MNKFFIFITHVLFLIHWSHSRVINNDIKQSREPGDPVQVTIFYENLNKVNRKFFIEEFKPVYDELWDVIDLELVPYGNTKKTSDNKFECPFGEKQCFANRVQACALKLLNSTDFDKKGTALFTYCMFKNREFSDIYELAPHCATQDLFDEWPSIEICQLSGDGDRYYTEMAEKTEGIQLVNGLAVQINGETQADYTSNLLAAVCEAYTSPSGETLDACRNTEKAPKIKVSVYYETLNIVAQNYFSRQIGPFYHLIEEFVEIDLIPYGNTQLETSNGANNFTCDSAEQCVANRIQALVVNDFLLNGGDGDEIDGPSRAINFIACMSSHPQWQNIYKAGGQCANQYLPPDDWIHLLTNATTSDSDEVYLQMKQKTDQLGVSPLPRIPMVTINGEPSIPTLNDFMQEVCARYTGKKPSLCTKVDVVVYYESLNHKSRKFIMEELRPAFLHFQSLINLRLLPAGRAHLEPGQGIVCPAGPDQCDGNKLQACVIDYFWNDGQNWTDPVRQEVIEFLYCMSQNKHAVGVWQAAEQCSEQNIEVDPWPTVFMCAKNEGEAILAEYIEETQSAGIDISHQNIPVVTINGNVSEEAVSDLIEALCDQFDEDHRPDKCYDGKAPKLDIDVYYESMSDLSKIFFTKQMGLYYRYIEEMVNLNLYPNGNVDDSGNSEGQCPTESDACVANQIQSIVIDWLWLHDDDGDQIDGSIRTVQFLSCFFGHPEWKSDHLKAGEYCSDNYLPNDDWVEIVITAKTEEGHQIYQKVQNKTQELKDKLQVQQLEPIPYVTLNGRHSLRTANDLLQSVCESYQGEKPLECTPVTVEIFYETLNPQSRRFFLEELRPTFENIRESFTIDFIPFGRANISGSGNDTIMDCPNGEQQCLGNKIQGCAIKHFLHADEAEFTHQVDGKNQTLSFIYCMFKNVDNEDITQVAEKCANQHFLEDVWIWDILMCAESEEGNDIMREMEERTRDLIQPLEHTPWVIINGQRSALAQTQLQQVVCDNLLGDRPEPCEDERAAKVAVEFHYQTGDSSVRDYVIQELYPSYRSIEEIIDLEIVPFGQTVVVKGDDGNYNFTCPNGPNECIGNKIHACVYEYFWHNDDDPISDNMDIDGKLQTLDFINCYFSHEDWKNDPYTAAEQCINRIFIDEWITIQECVRSGEIDPILAGFSEKVSALSPPLLYTPWITLNGKHNKATEKHFTRAICDAYTGRTKPWACYAERPPLEKPTVEIHYEPLNTDSQTFVISQLDHLKTHVDEIVVLDIVPFGRTVASDDGGFKCPNEDDCHTFKTHACVIREFLQNNTIQTLNFLVCAFGSNMNQIPSVTEECVNENFLDSWPEIEACARNEGDDILKEYQDRVANLNPKLSHVPWILVNGEHNVEAEYNLIQEICDTYYPDDKPSQCIPELLPVSINYQTMEDSVADFFTKQVKPFQAYFDEIASIDFVAYGLTQRDGSGFKCPKEDPQCNANKVHICVLHNFYDKENHTNSVDIEDSRYRTVGFLGCAFEKNSEDPVRDAEVCLNEEMGGDYWGLIETCAHGPDGNELMAIAAQKTEQLDPKIEKVPWVTINDTYSAEGETSLIHAICQSYPSVRPSICSSIGDGRVGVGLYFSSNQKTAEWVTTQLKQFFVDSVPTRAVSLQMILSTTFVPWGDTTYNEGSEEEFVCEDGPNECLANRIQACAIDQYSSAPKGWLQITEFVICFFSHELWSTNASEAGNQCANKVWFLDPWPQLDVCATSNPEVYLKMKEKSDQAKADYYPWVTINNQHNAEAESNLLGTVCDKYSGLKPEGCSSDVTQPTDGTTSSGQPTQSTSAPGQSTSEEPGQSTSEEPGQSTSEQPGQSSSEQPGQSTSEQPGQSTSEQPGQSTADPNSGSIAATVANCLFIIMSLILFL